MHRVSRVYHAVENTLVLGGAAGTSISSHLGCGKAWLSREMQAGGIGGKAWSVWCSGAVKSIAPVKVGSCGGSTGVWSGPFHDIIGDSGQGLGGFVRARQPNARFVDRCGLEVAVRGNVRTNLVLDQDHGVGCGVVAEHLWATFAAL